MEISFPIFKNLVDTYVYNVLNIIQILYSINTMLKFKINEE